MSASRESETARGEPSLRSWFYALGFLGLALALISIGDMFSTRPYDGIVPVPYRRGGIEVRARVPESPAAKAGASAAPTCTARTRRVQVGSRGSCVAAKSAMIGICTVRGSR